MHDAIPALNAVARRPRSPVREGVRRLLHNRMAMFGALLVVVEVCLALFAPILSAYEPNKMDYTALLSAPSAEHLLGTDELGRDIFTRMMYGARLSLAVGTMAVLLAIVLGVPFGLIAGYQKIH